MLTFQRHSPKKPIMRFTKDALRDTSKRSAGRLAVAAHWLAGARTRGTGILVYHRICDSSNLPSPPTMNVTPQRFREQLELLLQAGYRFVSLHELCQSAQSGDIPHKTLVVTFDDIFQNVYQNAWPVLAQLGIPATVFVATGFLDSSSPFPFDTWGCKNMESLDPPCYLPVTRDQCHEMQATGLIEIGAHTHSHEDFAKRLDAFAEDLAQCMHQLRSLFRPEAIPFAFPFGRRSMGAVNDAMIDIVRTCGAYCALTTDCEAIEPGGTPYVWGRFNVYQWDTATTIAAKVGGWYSWAPRLQDAFLERNRQQTK
jgi:peptidoglycan/xylan/chitin deacetylase (PgdA/CDA1 family)